MSGYFGQAAYAVRLDWAPTGAQACAADVAVVVDVLSFSTAVTVAVERGTRVYPCPWRDDRAQALATEHDAVVAVGRLEAERGDGPPAPSLSPAGLLAGDPVPRLVLPSPNGSTISAALADRGEVALGGLRNARAVGAWAAARLAAGRSVAVIAAGEHWENDGTLRPALEDQLGAGAVVAELLAAGYRDRCSPEALAAAALYDALRGDLPRVLAECVGGRELSERGYAADVAVAADVDASATVPVLRDGAFTAA